MVGKDSDPVDEFLDEWLSRCARWTDEHNLANGRLINKTGKRSRVTWMGTIDCLIGRRIKGCYLH